MEWGGKTGGAPRRRAAAGRRDRTCPSGEGLQPGRPGPCRSSAPLPQTRPALYQPFPPLPPEPAGDGAGQSRPNRQQVHWGATVASPSVRDGLPSGGCWAPKSSRVLPSPFPQACPTQGDPTLRHSWVARFVLVTVFVNPGAATSAGRQLPVHSIPPSLRPRPRQPPCAEPWAHSCRCRDLSASGYRTRHSSHRPRVTMEGVTDSLAEYCERKMPN